LEIPTASPGESPPISWLMPISYDVLNELLAPAAVVLSHIGHAFSRSFADLRDFNPPGIKLLLTFCERIFISRVESPHTPCHSRERTTTSGIARQSNNNFASVKNLFQEIDLCWL
jgi:hypothetical protein